MKQIFFFTSAIFYVIILQGCGVNNDQSESASKKYSKVLLYPVKIGNQYGYVNNQGEIIISPQFNEAFYFNDGKARIGIGSLGRGIKGSSKYGYIDEKGQMTIIAQYREASDFKDGLAWVKVDRSFGFIDTTGQFVINPQFDHVSQFSEGLAAVRSGKSWGYIDKTGKYVIVPSYLVAGDFKDGYARVSNKRNPPTLFYHFIDKSGKMLPASDKYYRVVDFNEGVARFSLLAGSNYGFINTKGEVVFQNNEYSTVGEIYHDGLTYFRAKNNKIGYLDKKGNVALDPVYSMVGDFSEGMLAARSDDNYKYGFINTKGDTVIPFKYDYVKKFDHGVAVFQVNDSTGIVDKNGREIFISKNWDEKNY